MMAGTGSSRALQAGGAAAILGLAAALAWVGATPGVDSIVWYVFAIVERVPADPVSLLQPIYNPPPMYTFAYRPLSTALVKGAAAAFGTHPEGLQAATFAHGLLLAAYGLAGRAAARAHGLSPRVSLAAALLSMVAPALLFSAWTLPEFDMVGGAFVLGAAAAALRRRLWLAAPLAACALLTKETAAVAMLAWLLAWASVTRRRRRRVALAATAAFTLALLAAVAPMFAVRPPVTHGFSVVDPRFTVARAGLLAFHDLTQLFVSVGAAGAAGVALAAAQGQPAPRRAGAGVVLAGVVLLLAPIQHAYNHYESVVLSHPGWTLAWGLALLGGLLGLAARGEVGQRLSARFALLTLAGLLAGPVLTGFSRADLSARLFAPALPLVFGLALHGLGTLRSTGRAGRVAAAALALALGWAGVAGAVNAGLAHRARFAVEPGAKAALAEALAAAPAGACPVVFETNRDHELAVEELARTGLLDAATLACLRVVQLLGVSLGDGDLWSARHRLDGADQTRIPARTHAVAQALEARVAPPKPVHLYVQGPRAAFPVDPDARPDRALAWAAGRMPDVPEGTLEQSVGLAYSAGSPLERTFGAAAAHRDKRAMPFLRVPPRLGEVPRRLLTGWPLLEPWVYAATRYDVAPAHGARADGAPARQ